MLARRDCHYDAPDADGGALTRDLLVTTTTEPTSRLACFEIVGTDPYSNIARGLEGEVFFDTWGHDAAMMRDEFGPYEQSSLFFLVIDTQAQAPAGVLRMIRNSASGLKTMVDIDDCVKSPIAPIRVSAEMIKAHHGIDDLDRCWDGATAAVPRRYRRRLRSVYGHLMLAVAAAAMRDDIRHFVSVLDAPVVKAARDVLKLPLVALAGTPPFVYMDTPDNQAVYAHVPSLLSNGSNGTDGRRNRRVAEGIRDCEALRGCVGGHSMPS
jgi:hypothetical protein